MHHEEGPCEPSGFGPHLGVLAPVDQSPRLMLIGSLFLVLVVFTLVIRGSGLPFAAALTRVVVTDWIYAWTRKPMILSALALLVGFGLWLGSDADPPLPMKEINLRKYGE